MTTTYSPRTIQAALDALAWLLEDGGAGGTYSMTCDEADALAATLAAAGHIAAAVQVLQNHATDDENPAHVQTDDRHAALHPSWPNGASEATALAWTLADGAAASAGGLWYDDTDRCRVCREHLASPHVRGCPGEKD